MPNIKDKSLEKYATCPYCYPSSFPLEYDKVTNTVFCAYCKFVVKIKNMDYPDMKMEELKMDAVPGFHWESIYPHKKSLYGFKRQHD